MEIIPRNLLFEDAQDCLGNIAKTVFGKSANHIETVAASFHECIDGAQVFGNIPVRDILRAVRIGHFFDFHVRYGWQAQFLEHDLKSSGGLVSDHDDILFLNGNATPVYLEIALQHQVVVLVVTIMGGTGEHVVVVGDGTVAGEDEVRTGQKLHEHARRVANGRVCEGLIVS